MEYEPAEPLMVLLNDLFFGIVRERALIHPEFFQRANLSLLLRQAVVSACTAMDVFFPALLEAHLPGVVEVRQRNFLPAGGDVRDFFREFYLRLHEIPALIEQEPANARWGVLTRHVLDYCRERTLSNVNGISAVMLMLGTDDPWRRIGGRAGVNERGLRDQIANIAKRRNDIIHRGDRPVGRPDEGPQPIDFAWTHSHVNAVQSVVLACDALAEDSVKQLKADAGGP
jgi:hypothetical protein